jgi:hypothetical protein
MCSPLSWTSFKVLLVNDCILIHELGSANQRLSSPSNNNVKRRGVNLQQLNSATYASITWQLPAAYQKTSIQLTENSKAELHQRIIERKTPLTVTGCLSQEY